MSRPFDEVRYRALLEGLEVVEIKYSTINEELRYEAEFFQKCYLREESALSTWLKETIGEIAYVTDGPHGYHVVDEASPIVMLTAKNTKDWFSEREGADSIAEWVHTANKRSSLETNDIILSTRGTVGMCALVIEETLPANIDQDVARISWKDKKRFIPGFVVAYLNSAYGQDHITRYASGMVQQGLSLQKVREIPIPILSLSVQKAIANIVIIALNFRRQTILFTQQAEQTLLRALGLENWQPPEPLTYTRSSRDAFAAGRLDAEHFQEKYYAARQALQKAGALDFLPIGDLLLSITNGHTPLYHNLTMGEVPFLCAEHVSDFEINYESEKRILDIHHRTELARTSLQNQDVLLTIKGRVGNAAIAEDVPSAVNINQDVALLRFNKKLPLWYIIAFLNCKFGKLQSEQMCTGAINPFLGLFSIRQFVIPTFGSNIMVEIAEQTRSKVLAARKSKRRAAELLNAAKRAVEIAIESGEAAALEFLNKTTEGGFSCT